MPVAPSSRPFAEEPSPLTPGTGLGQAVRRHRLLFVLPVLILTGAGVAFGLTRPPEYTAESRLMVGKVNANSPALGGFVQTTTALATAFSRSIGADAVIEQVAARTGLSPDDVARNLTATSIPQSPVVRVIATGDSAREAVSIARAAAPRLSRYVTRLNASNPDGRRLLRRYRAAALAETRAVARATQLATAYAENPTPALRNELNAAEADRSTAQLTADATGAAYQLSEQAQASTQIISVLALANRADSNRDQVLQMTAFAGLVAGLLVGLALAWTRESRVAARRRRT